MKNLQKSLNGAQRSQSAILQSSGKLNELLDEARSGQQALAALMRKLEHDLDPKGSAQRLCILAENPMDPDERGKLMVEITRLNTAPDAVQAAARRQVQHHVSQYAASIRGLLAHGIAVAEAAKLTDRTLEAEFFAHLGLPYESTTASRRWDTLTTRAKIIAGEIDSPTSAYAMANPSPNLWQTAIELFS